MSSRTSAIRQRHCAAVLGCAALLQGCGAGSPPAPAEFAAVVNRQVLTQEQLDDALRQRGGTDEAAERAALERLIDDELALQKARTLRLDQDPRVLRAVEAARRDIIVRAYRESTGDSASRPEADAVRRYYDDHPALFSQRRVYTLHDTLVEADAPQLQALQRRVDAKATAAQLAEHLKTHKLRFQSSQAVRAAEQLPMSLLPQLAALRDGQTLLLPAPAGARLLTVLASQPAPLTEADARPLIEQFLWNENKRRMVQADLKALREAASIEYAGRTRKASGDGGAAKPASFN